jgi:hypothetical protein
MSKLDRLIKYFPTGTTEGEKQLFERVFVTPNQLPDVITAPAGSPRVLVGNKGVGKTAILEWLFDATKADGIPAIFVRPDDLDLSQIREASDIGTIKRQMYDRFLDAIAVAVGRDLSGLLTGEDEVLYRTAIARGARSEDWMGKLVKLLGGLSKPITHIDAGKLATDLAAKAVSPERLSEALTNYLLAEKSIFLVLVDDTDQVCEPDNPQHLNRLWGLLLAVRRLTSENHNIKCIVTLRTEVWMRMLRNDRGQRDQIDHFRPLVLFLRAAEDHMRTIFLRRVIEAAIEDGHSASGSLTHFFEDEYMTLPTSTDRRSWISFLLKSSRERPRDLIQLVNHIANAAKGRGAVAIGSGDAEKAMDGYSRERSEDLAIEMGQDCPMFLDIIRSFVDLEFESSFEVVRAHLRTLPSRFAIQIAGRTIKPGDDADVITLLALIHESGFLNARVPDSTKPLKYRHVTFLDDPHLVQGSRWNELQSATWEVHPVFRTYLISLKRERDNRQIRGDRPPR